MLNNVMTKLKAFAKDEKGATAIEYAVMAALLIVVISAAIFFLQGGLSDAFSTISSSVSDATVTTPAS